MTVSSTDRSAGPYAGDGVATSFPFEFKVFSKTDLEVTLTDSATGVEVPLVLDSDYSVTLNADQDNDPGGEVLYTPGASAMPAGQFLVITSALESTQDTDITNAGRFLPQVVEDALDRIVILIQQALEMVGRAITKPRGDTGSMQLPTAGLRAGKALVFDEDGNVDVGLREDPASIEIAVGIATDAAAVATEQAGIATTKAGEASDDAASAAADAGAAQVARNASETAAAAADTFADMAMAGGNIYPDDTAGLAGTTSQNYYQKISPDDNEVTILMKDNAGVAQDTGRRIPSVKGVRRQARVGTRFTDHDAALKQDTGWRKLFFKGTNFANINSGTRGEHWMAFDVGTEVAADAIIDALVAFVSVAATATKIRVRMWEVPTTDANVNVGPPQASDVLVSDVTFTDLTQLQPFDGGTPGITLNSTERDFVFPLQVPVAAQAGMTYKVSFNALDNTDTPVTLAVGTDTTTGETRQRRAGGRRTTPAAATFTDLALTSRMAVGLLQRPVPTYTERKATQAELTSAAVGLSQLRLTAQNNGNHDRLAGHAALFSRVMPDAITNSGDSLVWNSGVTAGQKATDVIARYVTGTVNNVAADGHRSDQIRTVFMALSAGQQDDYGITDGGANDAIAARAGLGAVTIDTAGSGGTDGTFALAFSGGTGTSITTPTGTFTVVGGAVTAVNLTNPGGGYLTAPTVSTAASAGLTGATLTAVVDLVAAAVANMTAIANVSANRLLMAPWGNGLNTTAVFVQVRKITALLKAAFGARVFDAQPFWARYHGDGPTDIADVLRGYPPPSLVLGDRLHPNDAGAAVLGREQALMIRARAGIGAAYLHDELVTAPITASAAVVTMRVLGTATRFAIVDGNEDGAYDINATTGAITRSTSTTMPKVAELFVQADSLLGRTNVARVVVMRREVATTPTRAVRLAGNGGSALSAWQLTGAPTASKKLTFVLCARARTLSAGIVLSSNTGGTLTISSSNRRMLITLASPGLTLSNFASPYPEDAWDWNFYFFSVDTTTGVRIAKWNINEQTGTTSVPTVADMTMTLASLFTLFGELSGTPGASMDVKMVWIAPDYIDVADSAKRALFYNPTTKAPLDLGAAGTVSGITPLVYFQGYAGDYQSGNNRGTGGAFFTSPYINAANRGFVDLDS